MSERLDELDENEWWDVCRKLRPEIEREEFEREWREFQQIKAGRRMSVACQ